MGMFRAFSYLVSLPERTVRALAAGAGGLVYEATDKLLPSWIRQSRLYQALVAGTLRIIVELIGGVAGVLPPDTVDVQAFALRKAAGSGIELVGLLAVGWSPLWLLAAAADLTGGTRAYLRTLVSELQRSGALPPDADVASIDGLLNILERTSGLMAETLDRPPLNVDDMRGSWRLLQENVGDLPRGKRLANLYAQLERVARQQGRSLWSISSLMAAGAMRADIQMGQTYVFDYYRDALRTIAAQGLPVYAASVTKPYREAAVRHFDPRRRTHTECLLQPVCRSVETSVGEVAQE